MAGEHSTTEPTMLAYTRDPLPSDRGSKNFVPAMLKKQLGNLSDVPNQRACLFTLIFYQIEPLNKIEGTPNLKLALVKRL